MKIQVIKFSIKHGDKVHRKGETLDVPNNIAKSLIENGIAQAVVDTDKENTELEEGKRKAAADKEKAEHEDNPDPDTNGNEEDDDVEGLPPVEVEKIVKAATKPAAKKTVKNGK